MHKLAISGTTKLTGLMGRPVSHSKAPRVNNLSYELLDIDARYLAFDVAPEQLGRAVEGAKALGMVGFNVTVPHKGAVLKHLDQVTDAAQLMGSVNTVVVKDGLAIGHNTDAQSFTVTCKSYGRPMPGQVITLVDIGAEGPAYLTQAALEGAKAIHVVTADDQVKELRRRYEPIARQTGCSIDVMGLDQLDESAERFEPPSDESFITGNDAQNPDNSEATPAQKVFGSTIICNASRIGTGADEGLSPIPAKLINPRMLVLDAIYEPNVTALLASAHVKGAKVVGGLELLLNQAALAQKLWLDVDMPTFEIAKRLFM